MQARRINPPAMTRHKPFETYFFQYQSVHLAKAGLIAEMKVTGLSLHG